jgi:hypothetical protein
MEDRVNTYVENKWNLCISHDKHKLQLMANDLRQRFDQPNETKYFSTAGLLEFGEYVTSKYNLLLPINYLDHHTLEYDFKFHMETEESYDDNDYKSQLENMKKRLEKLKPFMKLNSVKNSWYFAGISYSGQYPDATKFEVEEINILNLQKNKKQKT